MLRSLDEVLTDIKELVANPGYIYPLLMILFEDFHIDPENLHKMNFEDRLNVNEACMLIGFLIQKPINFTQPELLKSLFELKKKTRDLMQELHHQIKKPFFEKQIQVSNGKPPKENFQDFFGQGDMLKEAIFYSGNGVFDFQYLDLLSRKYQYDSDWLKTNKGFIFSEVVNISKAIKEICDKKSEQVNLYDSEQMEKMKEKSLKTDRGNNFESDYQEIAKMLGLYQYVNLFFDDSMMSLNPKSEEFRIACEKNFYRNLVDLFTIEKQQVRALTGGDQFIKNFSIKTGAPACSRFTGVGAYNVTNSHPLIELDDERLLLPIPFILAEAIYEAPFYWLITDPAYKNIASTNRGNAGEEIVFQFLWNVFGDKTHRRVLVKTGANQIETDVDVLCVLGSKALCVQVKSKKLTELSRKGDNQALQKDFQGAVQDAYEQARVARQKMLDRTSKFFDEHGTEIKISAGIDDVYMLVVTTENYPSLTHQAQMLLKLKENSPSPLVLTAFDLEIITHYLSDPYDLLYYIRQRINLINYFHADEEIVFLGFHLKHKLWKDEKDNYVIIRNDYAQAIYRNYYPFRAGLAVSDKGDSIKSCWKDDAFDVLCKRIKKLGKDKVTDIIFHLYDLSGSSRTYLVKYIQDTKKKTLADNKFHSMSIISPDNKHEPTFGVTYFSSETDSLKEVEKQLLFLCNLGKYKRRSDFWLGLGSVKNSQDPFDFIIYNYRPWAYDAKMEENCKHLPSLVNGVYVNLKT